MTQQLPDHEERQRILSELDRCLLVEAAAGTGKTTSLVGRMVALLREGRCRVDEMVAVTFTRKATSELRSRFQLQLEQQARSTPGVAGERLQAALRQIDRCFIGTIHSFCARLLRERPIEAGVALDFEELDEAQDQVLKEQAWSDIIDNAEFNEPELWSRLNELGLKPEQLHAAFLEFATYPDIESWPAEEVPLGNLQPTRDALAAILQHAAALQSTFPTKRGNDELMNAYEKCLRLANNRDLKRDSELMEVLEAFDCKAKEVQKEWPGGKSQAKEEAERFKSFREQWVGPLLQRWREHRYPTVLQVLQQAADRYAQLRHESGKLNYQDLLMLAARLLQKQISVRQYFRSRYTHLLVDEFQDTDPIQAQMLLFLTATEPQEADWRKCRPVPGSLFVVGDPKQSIYRFRRADIVTYNEVKRILIECGGDVIPLRTNFRSVPQVVDWNNRVFEQEFPSAADAFSPASASMFNGRHDNHAGELEDIRVLSVPEDYTNTAAVIDYESQFIASFIHHAVAAPRTVTRSIKEADQGIPAHASPGDFMIVTAGKRHLTAYSQRLAALGVPHEMAGGAAFGEVDELRLLVECLRAVLEPENPVAFVAILRGELFGFSDAELFDIRQSEHRFSYRSRRNQLTAPELADRYQDACDRLHQYSSWLKRLPPAAAIERIVADLGLVPRALATHGGNLRAGTLFKALQVLRAQNALSLSLSDLLQRFGEILDGKLEHDALPALPHREPTVRLMNLHKAKGLEAPVVFLADPTGKFAHPVNLHIDRAGKTTCGYLAIRSDDRSNRILACPAGWATWEEQEQKFSDAEQKRLMYVAGTRAGAAWS